MRLPPEILGTIFDMARDRPIPSIGSEKLSFAESPHRWMRVRQVCQHWYNVAASFAPLWTFIALPSRAQLQAVDQCRLFLRNSRQSLLTIHLQYLEGIDRPLLREILSQLPRTQELYFSTSPLLTPCQAALLQAPVPHLRTLALRCRSTSVAGDDPDHLPILFGGVTPVLQCLAISLFTIYAKDNFRNLQQLHLSSQQYTSEDRVQSLLDLLDGSPSLEGLMFTSISFTSNTRTTSLQPRRCRLSNLKRLYFDSVTESYVGQMLSYLNLPTGLLLCCYKWTFSSFGGLLPADISYLSNLHDISRINLRFNAANCRIYITGEASAFSVDSCEIYPESHLTELITGLVNLLPLVDELWLEGRPASNITQPWHDLFNRARDVKRLVLRPNIVYFETLMAHDALPLLRELHILGFPSPFILESTQRFLQAREAHGHRLSSLHLYSSSCFDSEFMLHYKGAEYEREAYAMLRPYVDYMEIINWKRDPRMQVPPICNSTQTTGQWNWPTWVDAFPLGSPSLSEGSRVANLTDL